MWPLLSRGNFEAVRSPEHSKLLFAGEHVPGVPCTTNGSGSLLTPVGLAYLGGPRSAICRDSTSPRRLLPTKMLLPAPDTTSVASNSRCTQSSPGLFSFFRSTPERTNLHLQSYRLVSETTQPAAIGFTHVGLFLLATAFTDDDAIHCGPLSCADKVMPSRRLCLPPAAPNNSSTHAGHL